MNAGTSIAAVIAGVLGLAWLSIVISGSAEWGIGAFVVVLIMFFVSKRSGPGQRHRRTVMRADRSLRMNRQRIASIDRR